MYSSEITNQFIELRSRDISLERIAQQLGINKSTAIDWQRRYQAQIDEFKAIHLDAVRERLTTRYEDELEYAMTELKRIRAELKTRDWDYEATTFLHHAEAAAYRRVQKLCALADFPKSGRDATPLASANPQPPALNSSLSTEGRAAAPSGAASSCSASGQTDTPPGAASLASSGLCVEVCPDSQNPSKTQPFPHQNGGGSTPEAYLDHDHDLTPNAGGPG